MWGFPILPRHLTIWKMKRIIVKNYKKGDEAYRFKKLIDTRKFFKIVKQY